LPFQAVVLVGFVLVGWLEYVHEQSEAAQSVVDVRFPGPLALLRRPPGVSLRVADSWFEPWE